MLSYGTRGARTPKHADFLANHDGRLLFPHPLKGTFGFGTVFAESHANPPLNRRRRKRRAS